MKVRESNYLTAVKDFFYMDKLKPDVPKRYEKPLMGLHSNKNYIVLNAIDNILAGNNTIITFK